VILRSRGGSGRGDQGLRRGGNLAWRGRGIALPGSPGLLDPGLILPKGDPILNLKDELLEPGNRLRAKYGPHLTGDAGTEMGDHLDGDEEAQTSDQNGKQNQQDDAFEGTIEFEVGFQRSRTPIAK
jgi:hypothetical protein